MNYDNDYASKVINVCMIIFICVIIIGVYGLLH
jgi:hypothetical protein